MSVVTSFADLTRDWEGLLAAAEEHRDQLPNVEPHLQDLETALVDVRTLKDQQDSFRATKQRTTQRLREAKTRGREAAIRLRGYVKAKLGPKNEQLVQFGVAPIRQRSRQQSAVKPPVASAPGPAGPTPK